MNGAPGSGYPIWLLMSELIAHHERKQPYIHNTCGWTLNRNSTLTLESQTSLGDSTQLRSVCVVTKCSSFAHSESDWMAMPTVTWLIGANYCHPHNTVIHLYYPLSWDKVCSAQEPFWTNFARRLSYSIVVLAFLSLIMPMLMSDFHGNRSYL